MRTKLGERLAALRAKIITTQQPLEQPLLTIKSGTDIIRNGQSVRCLTTHKIRPVSLHLEYKRAGTDERYQAIEGYDVGAQVHVVAVADLDPMEYDAALDWLYEKFAF